MTTETVWHSDRVEQTVRLLRWGQGGTPVLLFPTAGGDAAEAERNGLVASVQPLIEAGRITVFSVDSLAGQSWLRGDDPRHSMWLQNQFDRVIYHEVVPAIRSAYDYTDVELMTAGASIGAFHAVASLCRHPDAFATAIGMSGTYDLTPWLHGHWSDDFYFSSPLHYLADFDDAGVLAQLRSRFVVLATGRGRWENEDETWKMADALGRKGVPNRVDLWSEHHDHDWPTWREMLPLYLDDLT